MFAIQIPTVLKSYLTLFDHCDRSLLIEKDKLELVAAVRCARHNDAIWKIIFVDNDSIKMSRLSVDCAADYLTPALKLRQKFDFIFKIVFVCVFQEHSLMLNVGFIKKNKSVKLKISRRSKTFSKLLYNYN